jgi:aerobic-type carbon monoxide dehydrogenase small subunit (CoxS/CutS family)
MSQISLTVNGRKNLVNVDPQTPLLFVLNDELGLRRPRFGCGIRTITSPVYTRLRERRTGNCRLRQCQ